MRKLILLIMFFGITIGSFAQVTLLISDTSGPLINRNIYGHFIEHMGTCIYDGLIRNGKIRMDIVEVMKAGDVAAACYLNTMPCSSASLHSSVKAIRALLSEELLLAPKQIIITGQNRYSPISSCGLPGVMRCIIMLTQLRKGGLILLP